MLRSAKFTVLRLLVAMAMGTPMSNAHAAKDLALEILEQETFESIGESAKEVVQQIGEYISYRMALVAEPSIIKERIRRCGSCSEKNKLLQELREAENNIVLQKQLDEIVIRALNIGPSKITRDLGFDIRPESVERLHPVSRYIWDRASRCSDKKPKSFAAEGLCGALWRLFNYSTGSNLLAFKNQLTLVNRIEAGLPASETYSTGKPDFRTVQTYIYNHSSNSSISIPRLAPDVVWHSVDIVTDAALATRVASPSDSAPLAGFIVQRIGRGHALQIPSVLPIEFNEPWRSIIAEDYKKLSEELVVVCRYKDLKNPLQYKAANHHWVNSVPEAADRSRLSSRFPGHPLLIVRPPTETCPSSLTEKDDLPTKWSDLCRAQQSLEATRFPRKCG